MTKNIYGTIFDIQRFSLHDGPGIRTTVFLKGCPLDCLWCHNPEGKLSTPQLMFDPHKCQLCSACVDSCENGVHEISENKHFINFESCNLSGACTKACPNTALSIVGNNFTVEEIIDIVMRDLSYYKNSGGGLTISGGEPMAQFEFTISLLKSAKKAGLHTVIETCGQAPQKRFAEIAEYVDLFLFDYKITDPQKHKKFTGVANTSIISNLEALLRQNANVILRCPIIPSLNNDENNFEGIADFCRNHPELKGVELMSYHRMGLDKTKKLGNNLKLFDTQIPTAEEKIEWKHKLTKLGCQNIKLY